MIFLWTALLGFWLIGTAAFLEYQSDVLLYSDLISGFVLVLIGLGLRGHQGVWKGWVIAIIGLWLNFAPLLFWAPNPAAYLNSTFSGMIALMIFLMLPFAAHQTPDEGPSVPPGWSFNPSSWPQRIPIIFLAFVCWMISRYLAAYQLGYIDSVWDPFFDQGTVNVLTSDVSKKFPVPDAGLGAFAYSLEVLSGFGSERRWRRAPWLVLLFGILTIPLTITSVILIMLQPIVVGSWCSLCLINAVIMLLPLPLAIDEVAASLQYLKRSKEKPFFKLLFEGGKCPDAAPDHRTPKLDRPLNELIKASLWGVTLPWNLCLCIFLGIWLMISPALFSMPKLLADADHVAGALIIVVTMTSFSEIARRWRVGNIALAALLLISSLFAPFSISTMNQLLTCLAIALLSFRAGLRREIMTYSVFSKI